MKQQTLELPILDLTEVPSNEKPVDVLVRLWDEVEQTLLAQRPPKPTSRQADPEEKTIRVRYAYD
ncbi:MAG: hypothetical protein L0Y56_21035 [Nitrospira sp.]|nr:hypothetical protein [Nitrospira sp.]